MKNKKNKVSDYKECWKFLKESKKYFYWIILLFILSVLFGYFFKLPLEAEQQILNMLRELIAKFEGLNVYQTTWLIFSNNVTVSFIALVAGVFLGIFPILATFSNGFILGYVANKAVAEGGILVLWRLLPHGIFELPAVFISLVLGTKLGFEILNDKKRKDNLRKSFLSFFLIVVPLLIIAAIIEGILVFFVK